MEMENGQKAHGESRQSKGKICVGKKGETLLREHKAKI